MKATSVLLEQIKCNKTDLQMLGNRCVIVSACGGGKLNLAVMWIDCVLCLAMSWAVTLRMPSALMSNVTSNFWHTTGRRRQSIEAELAEPRIIKRHRPLALEDMEDDARLHAGRGGKIASRDRRVACEQQRCGATQCLDTHAA